MAFNGVRNNLAYGFNNPLQALNPLPIIARRAPASTDTGEIGQQWIYNDTVWEFTSAATWTQLSGGSITYPLTIAQGGTNTTTLANTNGTTYYNGTSLATVSPGTSGHILTSNGAGSAPSYQSIDPSGTNVISFVDGDSGTTVAPVLRKIKILGGSGVTTSGSGDTITITSTGGSGIATLTATTGSATGGSVSITGTNSNIVTSATGAAFSIALANSPSVSGSVTAGTGFIATTGGLTFSNFIEGVLVTSVTGVATSVTGTAGYVLTANAAGTAPSFQVLPTSSSTFNGDSGSATGATITLAGGSNLTTSASGSTVTFDLDNSISLSGSVTSGTGFVATTGGLTFSNFAEGALVTSSAGVTSTVTGTAGYVLVAQAAGTAPAFAAVTSIGAVTSVSGNSGSAAPSSGVLTITGDGTILSTSGSGSTLSITSAAANVINATSGSATASSNAFSIVGSGDVTTSATGSTLTIAGAGATSIVTGSGTATVSSNAFTIANGSGITATATGSTITISATASSGIYPFTNVTGPTQAMAVNTGYVSNNGATLVTFTLPATAAVGAIVSVQGAGSGLFTIAQNSGQTINFNAVASTTGVGGSVNSTSQFDSIYLMCITANTTWAVNQSVGNFNVI